MLEKYYNRMSHLRLATTLLNDIGALEQIVYNFNRNYAINTLSSIEDKYESELQQISFFYSGRPIIKGEINTLYSHKSNDDLIDDAYYLINCLIIIGAVRFGMEKSIELALQKLDDETANETEPHNDTKIDFSAYIETANIITT